MFVVTTGCFGMAYWQWTRALDGSLLSWGYSFQWPLFGFAALALWVREVRTELKALRGESVDSEEPPLVSPFDRGAPPPLETVAVSSAQTTDEPDDAQDAYNHYLAWLAADPEHRPNEYPGNTP